MHTACYWAAVTVNNSIISTTLYLFLCTHQCITNFKCNIVILKWAILNFNVFLNVLWLCIIKVWVILIVICTIMLFICHESHKQTVWKVWKRWASLLLLFFLHPAEGVSWDLGWKGDERKPQTSNLKTSLALTSSKTFRKLLAGLKWLVSHWDLPGLQRGNSFENFFFFYLDSWEWPQLTKKKKRQWSSLSQSSYTLPFIAPPGSFLIFIRILEQLTALWSGDHHKTAGLILLYKSKNRN